MGSSRSVTCTYVVVSLLAERNPESLIIAYNQRFDTRFINGISFGTECLSFEENQDEENSENKYQSGVQIILFGNYLYL